MGKWSGTPYANEQTNPATRMDDSPATLSAAKHDTCRCRFIAHTADLSALGGLTIILMKKLICIKVPYSLLMPITGGKMMSKFTDIELEYLKTQRLGRLATINKHGDPQIAPVTFLYNADLETIDIGGLNNGESQKFRNVARNGLASFVVDDVLPPFQPRGIEIRGHAEAFPDGGKSISPNFSPALIRLTPGRIISWNLTSGDYAETHLARNV
jgi:pyridoxamine 5'-phosphate oxidase family protein